MNKYQVILAGFANEIADMPVRREYDVVEGIMKAFQIVNDKDLKFLDKPVRKRVLVEVHTEPSPVIILEMYTKRDVKLGYIYIKQII
jgi:hypothetical protein